MPKMEASGQVTDARFEVLGERRVI